MIWWPYLVVGIVLLILLTLFFALLYIYCWVFLSPHKKQGDDLYLSGLNYQGHENEAAELITNLQKIENEEVSIKSYDGLKLTGYIYENKGSKRVAIMCHGYRGTPRRDFSGGAIEMMKSGLTVLLIDERAHGKSEGHSIAFGVKEQKDVLSWIKYVKERFGEDVEIVLVGISMGGATVLFVSDKVDEKTKIIADCPYSCPKDIILETMDKLKVKRFLYPFVNLSSIIFAHNNLNKADASKSVPNSKCKILIIHGTGDTVVPYQLSEKIYLANKDKVQYEMFPGAEHGISYLQDRDRYSKIVYNFINK